MFTHNGGPDFRVLGACALHPPAPSWFGKHSGSQGCICRVNSPLPGVQDDSWGRLSLCGLTSHSVHEAGCTALGQDTRVQGSLLAVLTSPELRHMCPKGLSAPAQQARDSASGPLLLPLLGWAHGRHGSEYCRCPGLSWPFIFRMKTSSLTMIGCHAGQCCFAYVVGLDFSSFYLFARKKPTAHLCFLILCIGGPGQKGDCGILASSRTHSDF